MGVFVSLRSCLFYWIGPSRDVLCPQLSRLPHRIRLAVTSSSLRSGSMMQGDLPPSSSVTGVSVFAAAPEMMRATLALPV